MSQLEKALLFGTCAFALYLIYTDPHCNRICKNIVRTLGSQLLA